MMYFYEIRNTKTQETYEAIAKNFAAACKEHGWKPRHCRCVWKSSLSGAY